MTSATDSPRFVNSSIEEQCAKQYGIPNLQLALEGLHQDGMVVLSGVVNVDHCTKLYDYMATDKSRLMEERHANGEGFNQGVKSNILQCAPLTKPELLFDDVNFNPFVIQVLNAYLGYQPRWIFSTGNNALSGTNGMRQPVHKDTRYRHPKCPFLVVANTAICDFTIENGATEFWLGTHAFTDETCQTTVDSKDIQRDATASWKSVIGDPSTPIRPEAVEARRQIRPPIQALMKKGDVMLRDMRTWHAGMPNETDKDRIMLAQAWAAPWYPNYTCRLELPASNAEYFLSRAKKYPMQLQAEMVSDKQLEDNQHRDNFSFSPSEYLEHYKTAPKNYQYPFQY
ncbi:hypothetical protein BP6252_11059 [Coleophoma cylindrospora]|uniref:Phytanoyl-dioxygenase family protein n=1 Tax=Coleophoma cylindrospora TaxID=1849047 RepID=A0A3D8QPW9_9HELO|nr:hypothetical protein BP6252_11059 [Coleophoma cylindrospora]